MSYNLDDAQLTKRASQCSKIINIETGAEFIQCANFDIWKTQVKYALINKEKFQIEMDAKKVGYSLPFYSKHELDKMSVPARLQIAKLLGVVATSNPSKLTEFILVRQEELEKEVLANVEAEEDEKEKIEDERLEALSIAHEMAKTKTKKK